MAAGPVTIIFLDGDGSPRTGLFWSSDGTTAGTLSPLHSSLGADGASIASAANPVPATIENASLVVTGAAAAALALDAHLTNVQSAAGTPNATAITIQGNASGVAIPVSGASAPPNDVTAGPTAFTSPGALVVAASGSGSTVVQATGSGTGLSFVIQGSVDTTPTWQSIAAYTPAGAQVTPGTALTANGVWVVPSSGFKQIRVNLTAISGGTETFTLNSSAGSVVPPGASVTINTPPNDVISGPTNVTGALDVIVNSQGSGSCGLQITGTFTGLSGIVRATVDGSTYFNIPSFNVATGAAIAAGTAITAVGSFFIPAAGWRDIEFHVTAVSTGTAVVTLNASAGSIQPLITPAGGAAVDVVGVGGTAVQAAGIAGVMAVGGPSASGNSVTASPVPLVRAATANPTAVANGQVVNLMADKLGKLVAVGSIRTLRASTVTTITSSTAETTIVAQVASAFLDLYGLILANTSASSTTVIIKDSTGGTTRAEFEVPAGDTRGFTLPSDSGIPQATVNNNWTATCGTSVASLVVTALTVSNT